MGKKFKITNIKQNQTVKFCPSRMNSSSDESLSSAMLTKFSQKMTFEDEMEGRTK